MDNNIISRLKKSINLLEDCVYWSTNEESSKSKNFELIYSCEDELRAILCLIVGHEWMYDQCGYWQHKYCAICGEPKYPELASLKCGSGDQMKIDANEEEYNQNSSND